MSRFPFVLSSIAVAVLAGCAAEHHVTPAPAPVVVAPAPVVAAPAAAAPAVVVPQASGAAVVVPPTPGPLRVGFGRIDSITPIPVAAAGGGTVNSATRRVGVRMDDGTIQYVDTVATPLAVGDRVEITSDSKMRHPVP